MKINGRKLSTHGAIMLITSWIIYGLDIAGEGRDVVMMTPTYIAWSLIAIGISAEN